jgi:ribonuclease J
MTEDTGFKGSDSNGGASLPLRVIPLGGLGEIGLNMMAIEYDDSIIVVDCGLMFPEEYMLGIDIVIPDITYLKANRHKVKAFFITHGHEDHTGALPFVLREINSPIYATALPTALQRARSLKPCGQGTWWR